MVNMHEKQCRKFGLKVVFKYMHCTYALSIKWIQFIYYTCFLTLYSYFPWRVLVCISDQFLFYFFHMIYSFSTVVFPPNETESHNIFCYQLASVCIDTKAKQHKIKKKKQENGLQFMLYGLWIMFQFKLKRK